MVKYLKCILLSFAVLGVCNSYSMEADGENESFDETSQPSWMNEVRITGITCHNGEVGCFPTYWDNNDFKYGNKLTFEEYVKHYPEGQELPITEESFREFMSDEVSDKHRRETMRRFSTEVIFYCLEHKELNEIFGRLQLFLALLNGSEDNEKKTEISETLFRSLDSNFVNFMSAIDRSGKTKESFSAQELTDKLNSILKEIVPLRTKLICRQPYFE